MITTIGFDADDTLWHNERFFRITQDRFLRLLADHSHPEDLAGRLLAAERRNIGQYGFGIKGFVLSMIETALDVTNNRVSGHVIRELIEAGQDMLRHPIELLPNAREAIEELSMDYRLILITKGDLLDQERKLAQSGLGDLFNGIEIVSHKSASTYSDIFARQGDGADLSLMVGNSLKSDVVPAIEAGAWGVHVPHGDIWELEHQEPPNGAARFREIQDLGELPELVSGLLD